MATVVLHTLWHQGEPIVFDLVGRFGWGLPGFPPWFYVVVLGIGLAICFSITVNLHRSDLACVVSAGFTAGAVLLAVLLGGFVLWTPVGDNEVFWVQGRYTLPALAVLTFGTPPLKRFNGKLTAHTAAA